MITVHVDISPAIRHLDSIQRKQVPFATSVALNRTAKLAQEGIRTEMSSVFESPKPYTLGGTFTKPSTKTDLTAIVGLKDQARGGRPPAKYLRAEVTGGLRRSAGYELVLSKLGALPNGWRALPAGGAKMDRYGNMQSAQLTEIIGALKSGARIYKGKGKRGHAAGYFIASPGGRNTAHLAPGIYYRVERNGESAIIPVLIFVASVTYKPRLNIERVVRLAVARHLQTEFNASLARALATAR